MYIVYANPTDCRRRYAVRGYSIDEQENLIVGDLFLTAQSRSLKVVRKAIPAGSKRYPAHPLDPPVIAEVWIDRNHENTTIPA
jgi:hypothetical protein